MDKASTASDRTDLALIYEFRDGDVPDMAIEIKDLLCQTNANNETKHGHYGRKYEPVVKPRVLLQYEACIETE